MHYGHSLLMFKLKTDTLFTVRGEKDFSRVLLSRHSMNIRLSMSCYAYKSGFVAECKCLSETRY